MDVSRVGKVALLLEVLTKLVLLAYIEALKPWALLEMTFTEILLRKNPVDQVPVLLSKVGVSEAQVLGVVTETDNVSLTLIWKVALVVSVAKTEDVSEK